MQRKDDAEREQIKEMEKAEMKDAEIEKMKDFPFLQMEADVKDAEMKGAEMEVEAKKQRWKKI